MNEAAEHYFRLLGRPDPANETTHLTARDIIKVPSMQKVFQQAETDEYFAKLRNIAALLPEIDDELGALLNNAKSALESLQTDGADAHLTNAQQEGLDAVLIACEARPSIATSDLDNKELGNIGVQKYLLEAIGDQVERLSASVGAIIIGGQQIGTGFVAAEGIILTARHVVEALLNNQGQIDQASAIRFEDGRQFSFAQEVPMTEIEAFQSSIVNFSQLDCAALALMSDTHCPKALTLSDARSAAVESMDVITIGYPGKPRAGSERFSVLQQLFGFEFGIQRVALGEIIAEVGEVDGDSVEWIFSHDCTTLGGCSGSPVIDISTQPAQVIGVHFAGERRVANFAHSTAAIRSHFEELDLNYE